MNVPRSEFLFIDGFSLIFRAYYSHVRNPLTTADGRPTSAIFGFMSMLITLLDLHKPAHALVALDSGRETFRRELYSEYKANRSDAPDDLKVQFETIFQLIDCMGLKRLAVPGKEADDIIGSYSRRMSTEGRTVLIASGDRDLFQLLDERVRMLFVSGGIRKSQVFDPATLLESQGLTPAQIPDFKALAGDASDNIPGVKGIGEKGAKEMLKNFQTLDGLYANLEALKPKQQEKLRAEREQAYLYRTLATIDCSVELPWSADELAWDGPDAAATRRLLEEFEVRALADRVEKLQVEGVQGWLC